MIFYTTIILCLIIDFITKYLALTYLKDGINILGNFIFLQYTENTGIAFGINIPFLKILTIILIIGIFCYYFKGERKKKNKLVDFSFGLILGGAVGNGIERIFNGKVIDFIGIKYFSVFNFADICITIGALVYIFYLFKYDK